MQPLLWLLHLLLTHSNTTSITVDGRAGLRMRRKYLRIQLLSLQCARRTDTDSGDPSHRSCRSRSGSRSRSRSRGPPSPCCSVRNVPCDKRFFRGDNLPISDRIYPYARGWTTSTPTARRERGRSRNQFSAGQWTMDPVRYAAPSDRRVQRPCSRWWIDYDKFANQLRCMILN